MNNQLTTGDIFMNNRDYTGKMIFVGIDVHKKNYVVSSVCDKRLVKRRTMKNGVMFDKLTAQNAMLRTVNLSNMTPFSIVCSILDLRQ
jgi:hypothetical protein